MTARLTYVYRAEDMSYVNVGRRQLPVVADDNLMMLMDLNSKGLAIDCPHIRGKELEEFTRKFNLLNATELRKSLEIDSDTFVSVLNQCVQCVGCRRRVERLFYQLTLSGHATLDPLVLNNSCTLSIVEEKMKTPQALGTLLYRHHDVLNNLLESKLRNKTRCVLHSLDAFRSKPFSETWREVWTSMKHNCRDELAVIETKELHEVLENYLKKHKFCQGCRTKIEKAYKILIGECTTKEKGFVAALYANIKKCHPDKHIHVITNKVDFLDALLRRAEPEVNGSYSKLRERHAKTLEIAQEEVLTCVGMIMYERLRRIYVSLREEERACQVLAAVGVHALCRSFDLAVEKKQGISNLELLTLEISRAERAKELKRELRKLKKKKKKIEKRNLVSLHHNCQTDSDEYNDEDDDDEEEEDDEENLSAVNNKEKKTAADTAIILNYDDVIGKQHREEEGDDEDEAVVIDAAIGDFINNEDDDDFENPKAISSNEKINNINKNVNNNNQQLKPSKRQKQKQKKNKKKQQQQQQQQQQQHQQNKKQVQEHVNEDNINSNMTIINNKNKRSTVVVKCDDCLASTPNCPCESDVKDSGYGSEPNSHGNSSSRTPSVASTPDGSIVSCSEGFCNHHHNTSDIEDEYLGNCCLSTDNLQSYELTIKPGSWFEGRNNALSLLQMLDECKNIEEDNDENCYIPQDVIIAYKCQQEKVQKQREELRENLRKKFAQFCQCRGNAVAASPQLTYSCK